MRSRTYQFLRGVYILDNMENEVLKKKCNSCNIEKQLKEYHKASWSKDGTINKCIQCVKDKVPTIKKAEVIVEDGYKKCTSCEEIREIKFFVKDKHRPDGLAGNCKICRKENDEKRKSLEKEIPEHKICSNCKDNLLSTMYHKCSSSMDGLASLCKTCTSEKYYESLENKVYKEVDEKVCKKCKLNKSIDQYHKKSSNSDGYNSECKECAIEKSSHYYQLEKDERVAYQRDRRKNNYEKLKEINRKSLLKNKHKYKKREQEYREKNKERIKEVHKIWRTENKEDLKRKKKEYAQKNPEVYKNWLKNKKEEDPLFKLGIQLRVAINNTFKRSLGGKFSKNKKTLDIIGCDFDKFNSHLESQFLNWMTFENHGRCKTYEYNCSWHMDHIIPLTHAKTEEDIYLLNHWSNFQPMCGQLNLEKNGKIYPCSNLELGITFWEDRYESFVK